MSKDHFVNDGRQRALVGLADRIPRIRSRLRRQILADYADKLRRAGFWRRMYLKAKIRREIEKRVAAETKRMAPGNGLYLAK